MLPTWLFYLQNLYREAYISFMMCLVDTLDAALLAPKTCGLFAGYHSREEGTIRDFNF